MATATVPSPPATRLTPLQWTICITAAIGFLFDSYVLLMLPLVLRRSLAGLLGVALNSPAVNTWSGYMLNIPAVAGGIFGLLGGYLTDLFGRRRVLVWAILLHFVSAIAAGYSTTVGELLFWRCCTFVGVCVEFVAAVAWLAELFPNPKQRESVIGYSQLFGSMGGIMAAGAYSLIVAFGDSLPAVRGTHDWWRYMFMSSAVPALPLMIIRPFLPESPTWQAKKAAGTLKRPSFAELFRPQFRTTTLITTLMMACSYAAAFGAIQQVPRIVPGLAEVRAMTAAAQELATSTVQSFQEFGGFAGRFFLAFLAVRILSRRRLLRVFQVPGLILLPIVFLYPALSNLTLLRLGIFLVGFMTVAQFSFWGNYLPRVYPTYLRGTGESFAANVGGRMLGTTAALLTTQLVAFMPAGPLPARLAYASAVVGTGVYVIGFVASFWLPEPRSDELPD
jgi:MFS family permease